MARPASLLLAAALVLQAAPAPAQESGALVHVVLRWQSVGGAATYELEIATDPSFAPGKLEISTKVNVPAYRWAAIPEIRYHWRVRSVDANGRVGPWSETKTIEPALSGPVLLSPASGARFALDRDRLAVGFACEPSKLLKSYAIAVARDAAFSEVVARWSGPSCEARLEIPGPGTYHWRVTGTTLLGKEAPASTARTFTVALGFPRASAPDAGAVLPWGPVTLRWEGIRTVARWRVTVTAEGEPAWQAVVDDPQATFVPGRPGRHLWSIAALDAKGSAGPASPQRSFEVQPAVRLTAPHLASPADGAVVGAEDPAAAVLLRWDTLPGASRYDYQVARPGELETAAVHQSAVASVPAEALPEGRLAWRVRAVDAAGIEGAWSEPLAFFHGRPPTARAEVAVEPPRLLADGASTARIEIRLLDEEGRPVRGAPLRVTTSAGRIEGLGETASGYQARLIAASRTPPGDAAEVTIADRGFQKVVRVEMTRRKDLLFLGATVGWVTNFEGLSTFAVGLDFTWRTPLLGQRLLLSGRAGYYGTSASIPLPTAAGASTEAAARIVPLSALALYEHPLGAAALYGGAGFTAQIVSTSVLESSAVGFAPGGDVVLGVSGLVGPGRLYGEIDAGAAWLSEPLVKISLVRFLLNVGYRFQL
jgi:hypothetical protein